ncbi:MAG TPA: glycosyltransferase family A protein [Gaiellaceae bacterium]|nr:glycosyltransferase family A protein [Gaiellaceae bacterium]
MTQGQWSLLAPDPPFVVDRGVPVTFSVAILAYESAAFIGAAVESALDQTEPPHEVIVSDDGSTDDLEAALAPFRRQIVLVRGEHGGPAAARNRALHAATGDFLAALDADDAYHPERLAALRELAARRPDLDVLSTDALIEVDGEVVGRFNATTPFQAVDQRREILRRCFVTHPAVRRSRLLAVGGYDETLSAGEDWDAVLRLILAGSAAGLVDEPLYTYRFRPGSVTSQRVAALRSRVQLLEKARTHPGLSPGEARFLEHSIRANRQRVRRAEAEVALIESRPGRRRRALGLALAPEVGLRARARALSWAMDPGRAGRALAASNALESTAPWRRLRP